MNKELQQLAMLDATRNIATNAAATVTISRFTAVITVTILSVTTSEKQQQKAASTMGH